MHAYAQAPGAGPAMHLRAYFRPAAAVAVQAGVCFYAYVGVVYMCAFRVCQY